MTLEKYRLECGHEAPLSAELLASVTAAPTAASDAAAGNGGDEDPLSRVAGRAQGFTGSDLVQLCSEAVRQPMREAMDAADGAASFSGQAAVRPLELRCSSRAAALYRVIYDCQTPTHAAAAGWRQFDLVYVMLAETSSTC